MDRQPSSIDSEDLRKSRIQRLEQGQHGAPTRTSQSYDGERYDWTKNDFFNTSNIDTLASTLKLALVLGYFSLMIAVIIIIFGSLN